jgi:predicted NAD-dependent protein-ADP-ribosyltransferase YbiA (DUF1768 family)
MDKRTVIKIYNPKDFPFGPLSNNYVNFMVINGKQYGTVTNYILSNMMITPVYRISLQLSNIPGSKSQTNIEHRARTAIANAQARSGKILSRQEMQRIYEAIVRETEIEHMSIYQLYNYYLGLEHYNLVRKAVEKCYNSKLTQYPELSEILLKTDNQPIRYVSGNNILGTGPDGNGANLIGITLMQIRHNMVLQNKEKAQERNKYKYQRDLINTYLAYRILSNTQNLETYLHKSPSQIVKIYNRNNTPLSYDRDSVVQLVEYGYRGYLMVQNELADARRNLVQATPEDANSIKQQIEELEHELEGYKIASTVKRALLSENPVFLISFMTRERTENIKRNRNRIIVEMYTKYFVNKKYPNLSENDREQASKQLVYIAPSRRQYDAMTERIVSLYNKNELPQELTDNIRNVIDVENYSFEEVADEVKQQSEKTSSSEEEANPLKKLLAGDETSKKHYLIQLLQKYTGKSARHYKKYNVKQLDEKVAHYTRGQGSNDEPVKQPKKSAGHWEVWAGHPRPIKGIGRREKLAEYPERPLPTELEELINKYNKEHENQIKRTMISVRWVGKIKPESEEEEEEEKVKEDKVEHDYLKPHGDFIEIKPLQNEPDMEYFSPLYNQPLTIDNLVYPNCSIYITTMLLTHTGKTSNLERGTSVEMARKMLMVNNEFVSVGEAGSIYEQENIKTHKELLATYCNVALSAKFNNDVQLQELLLSTKNAELLWSEPNDMFLGAGTKEEPGENYVGRSLMNIRTRLSQRPPLIKYKMNINNIESFLLNEKFIHTWMRMRVSDMCNTVYKLKDYLEKVDNQIEDIDEKFVNNVLDVIYQPCSPLVSMSNNIQVPVPAWFVKIVENTCNGMKLVYSTDFTEQIKAIETKKMQATELYYYGVIKKTVEPVGKSIEEINQKHDQRMEVLKKQNLPVEAEEKRYRKELQTFEDMIVYGEAPKRVDNFGDKQREEWRREMQRIFNPALSAEEREEKLRKFNKNLLKEITKAGYDAKDLTDSQFDEKQKMLERHNKRREEFMIEIMKPVLSQTEIKDRLRDLQLKQEEEFKRHYNMITTKTAEEEQSYNDEIKRYNEQMLDLHRRKKSEYNNFLRTLETVSQIYWNKIVIMIYFLLQTGKQSMIDVKQAIIDIVQLNSAKTVCSQVISSDDEQNCIASAITNILIGIEKFKHQYADALPLGIPDIQLSVSIILDQSFKPDKSKKESSSSSSSTVEEEEVSDKYLDFEDEDFADENSQESFDENAITDVSFGMRGPKDNSEEIKALLQQISKNKIPNLKEVVAYFNESIKGIMADKTPYKVKQNRVNFFATLR